MELPKEQQRQPPAKKVKLQQRQQQQQQQPHPPTPAAASSQINVYGDEQAYIVGMDNGVDASPVVKHAPKKVYTAGPQLYL